LKKLNKLILPFIILLFIIIYGVITFPRSFIRKTSPIMVVHIDYTNIDTIIPDRYKPMYLLETNEEINNFINVLEDYKYRNYLFKPYNGSHAMASSMMIDIYYNEEKYDIIYLNSNGQITLNFKPIHIGFMGKEQAKQLYDTIYDQMKDKFNINYGPYYNIKLPNDYTLISSSSHNLTLNKQIDENNWGEAIIPAEIVKIAWDDNYILAKQIGLKRRNPNNIEDTYGLPDESKVSYWILEIQKGTVYGPLKENEFIEKRKELLISTDIILKHLYDY
jgi:hypothetical protein